MIPLERKNTINHLKFQFVTSYKPQTPAGRGHVAETEKLPHDCKWNRRKNDAAS